jgi:hypothetical protein
MTGEQSSVWTRSTGKQHVIFLVTYVCSEEQAKVEISDRETTYGHDPKGTSPSRGERR